eukprot:4479256-Prymnesium_polylepis.1
MHRSSSSRRTSPLRPVTACGKQQRSHPSCVALAESPRPSGRHWRTAALCVCGLELSLSSDGQ